MEYSKEDLMEAKKQIWGCLLYTSDAADEGMAV